MKAHPGEASAGRPGLSLAAAAGKALALPPDRHDELLERDLVDVAHELPVPAGPGKGNTRSSGSTAALLRSHSSTGTREGQPEPGHDYYLSLSKFVLTCGPLHLMAATS